MFCNFCGKNPSVVHYSQVINNQVTEMHLCESCAKKQGFNLISQFSVSDFLGNISGDTGKNLKELQCSVCGLTLSNFKKTGRLGCSQCYITFKDFLAGILKRIQGSEHHAGKIPARLEKVSDKDNIVLDLKQELKQAIEKEEYEKAAKIRDKLKKIK